MSKARFRAAMRVAVVILLTWTSLDLSADLKGLNVCALDQHRLTEAPLPRSGVEIDSSTDTSDVPAEPDAHFDDCFCCSHCVEPTSAYLPLEALHALEPLREVSDGPAPPFCWPLYHPPLTLLG